MKTLLDNWPYYILVSAKSVIFYPLFVSFDQCVLYFSSPVVINFIKFYFKLDINLPRKYNDFFIVSSLPDVMK